MRHIKSQYKRELEMEKCHAICDKITQISRLLAKKVKHMLKITLSLSDSKRFAWNKAQRTLCFFFIKVCQGPDRYFL